MVRLEKPTLHIGNELLLQFHSCKSYDLEKSRLISIPRLIFVPENDFRPQNVFCDYQKHDNGHFPSRQKGDKIGVAEKNYLKKQN